MTENKNELSLVQTFKHLLSESKGFWLINMINFGDGIAYFGILALLTRFLGTRLGMSDQVTGISVSFYTGLVTLFMLGGGAVSDRLGVRRGLSLSLLLMAVGRIFLSSSPMFAAAGPTFAWFGLLLVALGSGILQPALYAGVKEYTDPRTATIGYGLLYAIMNLGIIAENFISPYIRTSDTFINFGFAKMVGLGWGIDGVFWLCTALTGAMLLAHMTFFTKKVEEHDRVIKPAPREQGPARPLFERLKELPVMDGHFMFFIFILLPVRTLFAHQFLTMPDYIFRCFPKGVTDKYEWIAGLNPLMIVIGVPLIASLTRKSKVIDMMIVGTMISAFATFMLVPAPSLTMLLLYVAVFTIGEAFWSSRFLEYVADIAPAGRIGLYMGIAGIPWFLAKATTGLYSGFMLKHFIPEAGPQNSGVLWFIYGCVACLSPVGLILARRWLLKGEQEIKARFS